MPTIAGHDGKRKRVLVVDDEPALCKLVYQILSRSNEVVTLTSPRRALELLERGERFDAILSDIMMPEITGLELHDRLLRVAPAQAAKMIFMSGGAFPGGAAEFLKRAPGPTIEKPFKAADLQAVIDGVLNTVPT